MPQVIRPSQKIKPIKIRPERLYFEKSYFSMDMDMIRIEGIIVTKEGAKAILFRDGVYCDDEVSKAIDKAKRMGMKKAWSIDEAGFYKIIRLLRARVDAGRCPICGAKAKRSYPHELENYWYLYDQKIYNMKCPVCGAQTKIKKWSYDREVTVSDGPLHDNKLYFRMFDDSIFTIADALDILIKKGIIVVSDSETDLNEEINRLITEAGEIQKREEEARKLREEFIRRLEKIDDISDEPIEPGVNHHQHILARDPETGLYVVLHIDYYFGEIDNSYSAYVEGVTFYRTEKDAREGKNEIAHINVPAILVARSWDDGGDCDYYDDDDWEDDYYDDDDWEDDYEDDWEDW